jgi:uncharacterized protein YukE
MADLDLGTIAVTLQLTANQLEETVDTAVKKLNQIGETGLKAQNKINPLSPLLSKIGVSGKNAGTDIENLNKSLSGASVDKYNKKLMELNKAFEEQKKAVAALGVELDETAKLYSEMDKAMGRSGDVRLEVIAPELTAKYDAEIAKLDELKRQIQIVTAERERAAQAAINSANRQTEANETLGRSSKSTRFALDTTATAIRTVANAAGNGSSQIGYLATEILYLKRNMDAAKTSGAALGAVLSFGVMAAVTVVSYGIQKLKEAEEERRKSFEEGFRNYKAYQQDLRILYDTLRVLTDHSVTTQQLITARNNLASTFPGLITGYTEEGEAIIASTEAIERHIKALEDEERLNRNKVIAGGKASSDEYFKMIAESSEENRKKLIAVYEEALRDKEAFVKSYTDSGSGEAYANTMYNNMKRRLDEEIEALEKIYDLKKETIAYNEAYILNNIRIKDSVTGIVLNYEDLDNKTKTVISSLIRDNEDLFLINQNIEDVLESIIHTVSDPQAFETYSNNLIRNSNSAFASTEKLITSLKEASQAASVFVSGTEAYNKALDKMKNGTTLTYDEVNFLVSMYPELYKSIIRTADGYSIQAGALEQLNAAARRSQAIQLETEIAKTETAIAEAEKRIKMYEREAATLGQSGMDVTGKIAAISTAKQEIAELKSELYASKLLLDELYNPTPRVSSSSTYSDPFSEVMKQIENKKALNQLTAQEELAWLERIRSTYKLNAEERIALEIKTFNLKKALYQDEVDSLDKLGEAITSALKAKYAEMEKAEEKRIRDSIKAWEEWEDRTVKAIQAEIDALDELEKKQQSQEAAAEYSRKSQELKLQLAYEKDEYQRKQIEKELNRLTEEEKKRQLKEENEVKKADLRAQIDKTRDTASARKEALQEELEAIRNNIDELTSTLALRAQAEQIIMKGNQKDMVQLIKSFAPEYALAGNTIGESLYNALTSKAKSALTYVQDVLKKVENYASNMKAAANKAASDFESTFKANQAVLMSKSAATPNVYQNINIYQPVESPIAVKRAVDDANAALASSIMK